MIGLGDPLAADAWLASRVVTVSVQAVAAGPERTITVRSVPASIVFSP